MRLIIAVVTLLGIVGVLRVTPATASPKSCKVIAYVIHSKDKNYPPGQKICIGEIIPTFAQVTVACTIRNNHFLVEDNQQLKQCETESTFPARGIEKNRDRGGYEDKPLVLLSPRGRYLIKQKLVKFVWLPVMGAKKYYIKVVDGTTGSSQAEYIPDSNSFSIPFPKNSASFTIIIKSFSDISEINSAVYSFVVLPENTQQLVTKYLTNIDKISISEKEKIQLKLSVLGDYNLIDESLSLLNSQTNKDSQDYESYLSLGDFQLFNGKFVEANKSYLISKGLAEKYHNLSFKALAKSRLEFVGKYIVSNATSSKFRLKR
jgi:hypothetical protein